MADPGGVAGAPPPQQDPILSFSHMFSPKSTHVGGRRPPPPQREILDPPLNSVQIMKSTKDVIYVMTCLVNRGLCVCGFAHVIPITNYASTQLCSQRMLEYVKS